MRRGSRDATCGHLLLAQACQGHSLLQPAPQPSGMATHFCNCNIFILNWDFLEGSPFWVAKPSTHSQGMLLACDVLARWFYSSNGARLKCLLPRWQDQWQQRAQQKLPSRKASEKVCCFHSGYCSSGCHTRFLDEQGHRPKTIPHPSTGLFKE